MKTPFNVLAKHTSWDKAPRDPITIGNAIIAGLGMSTSSLAVIWLTGFVATTLEAGALMRALMPSAPKMQQGLLGNFRQAAAPWDVVYGQVRKGGTITYMESTGDTNKYLHMIVTLAGHEVEEIGDIYINDKVVTIDGNDEVTSEPWVSGAGGADKWITIKKFTGASNQNIYNSLQSMTDGPTFENEGQTNTPSNFKGQGISCIYVRMEYNRDVFASGIPSFSAVVKGKKVYDPRTSTTGWSANAALCIRDYLVNEYGLNTLASSIDDTYFSTAANDCDTSSGSGESNKFEINGVITTSANIRTNLQDMVGACVGNLYYSAGQFKLVAGVYSPSVKTLTLDDLRSEISLNTRTSRRDNFNSVQGTFIWGGVDDGTDSGGDWTEFDYPAITSAPFVTEDNQYDNPLQLDLPLTTGSATAQRIAKQTLFRAREQMSFSAEFGMSAFDLQIGDTVSLTLDRYGWVEKEFEVVNWGFKADQDAGDLRVTLSLRETSSAAFDWDAEEQSIIGNNSNLPQPNEGLIINNLTASAGGRIQGDGTFINSAILDWDDIANAYLDYYDIEWKILSDSVYNSTTSNNSNVEISPLIDNIEYVFRVRAVATSGNQGPWASVQFTGGGDDVAPSVPTSVSATGGFRYITINWTNPSDADLKHVEVWENDTNTTSGASLVGVSGGSEFIRSNLNVDQTKYYFLKSVDFSDNKSDFTSGVSATTTWLDDPDFENGVYSLFTEQGLYAIEDVTSLPASGSFEGQKVFNRTDGKLYQWTGSAWEQVVGGAESFGDLQGSIAQSQIPNGVIDTAQIADDAIIAGKISANAVGANAIAANSIYGAAIQGGVITGDKITANTITGGLIAASGIITNSAQINDAIITNAKISNIAADKITAGTLDVARLPGIGVAGATAVDSSFITSGTVNVTVSFSGVTIGSSMIAVLTGRFGMSKSSPQISITPVGTNVTLAHTQSTGGFVSENATPITAYNHAVSATATSTSGSLGFTLSGSPDGRMYYGVAVSLLTFKA